MIGSWPSTSAIKGGDDMPEPLTSRQREILEYLRFRQKIRSYPPTVREIGEAVGLSSRSPGPNPPDRPPRNGHILRAPTKGRPTRDSDTDELPRVVLKGLAG